MENGLQRGYLSIADISGYTSYVTSTEIEHSQEIIQDFLNVIVNQLTKIFDLAEIEGDGVFVYAPVNRIIRKETFPELIEKTYYEFRKNRDIMYTRSKCTCNACMAIPTLDLKFISHFGEYVIQNVATGSKPMVMMSSLSTVY